jgi:hypothetical protein
MINHSPLRVGDNIFDALIQKVCWIQVGRETGRSHGLNPVSGGEVRRVWLLEMGRHATQCLGTLRADDRSDAEMEARMG